MSSLSNISGYYNNSYFIPETSLDFQPNPDAFSYLRNDFRSNPPIFDPNKFLAELKNPQSIFKSELNNNSFAVCLSKDAGMKDGRTVEDHIHDALLRLDGLPLRLHPSYKPFFQIAIVCYFLGRGASFSAAGEAGLTSDELNRYIHAFAREFQIYSHYSRHWPHHDILPFYQAQEISADEAASRIIALSLKDELSPEAFLHLAEAFHQVLFDEKVDTAPLKAQLLEKSVQLNAQADELLNKAKAAYAVQFHKPYRSNKLTNAEIDKWVLEIEQATQKIANNPIADQINHFTELKTRWSSILLLFKPTGVELQRVREAFTSFKDIYTAKFLVHQVLNKVPESKTSSFDPHILDILWVHGTTSAIFSGLPKTNYQLLPTAQLQSLGIIPLSGELAEGSAPIGINNQHLSGCSLKHWRRSFEGYASNKSYGFDLSESLRMFEDAATPLPPPSERTFDPPDVDHLFYSKGAHVQVGFAIQRVLAFRNHPDAQARLSLLPQIKEKFSFQKMLYEGFVYDEGSKAQRLAKEIVSIYKNILPHLENIPPALTEEEIDQALKDKKIPIVFGSTVLHPVSGLGGECEVEKADLKNDMQYAFVNPEDVDDVKALLIRHQLTNIHVLPINLLEIADLALAALDRESRQEEFSLEDRLAVRYKKLTHPDRQEGVFATLTKKISALFHR